MCARWRERLTLIDPSHRWRLHQSRQVRGLPAAAVAQVLDDVRREDRGPHQPPALAAGEHLASRRLADRREAPRVEQSLGSECPARRLASPADRFPRGRPEGARVSRDRPRLRGFFHAGASAEACGFLAKRLTNNIFRGGSKVRRVVPRCGCGSITDVMFAAASHVIRDLSGPLYRPPFVGSAPTGLSA